MKEWQSFKTWIALNYSHFLPLATAVKVEVTDKEMVAKTNGKIIEIGSKFREYEKKRKKGVLLHELLHVAFLHSHGARNLNLAKKLCEEYELDLQEVKEIMQMSADLIVNTVIQKHFRNEVDIGNAEYTVERKLMLLKQIYGQDKVEKEIKELVLQETLESLSEKLARFFRNRSFGFAKVEMDIPFDRKEGETEASIKKHEKEIKQKLQEGLVIARMRKRGTEAGGLEELIERFLKGEVNWFDILKHYLQFEKSRFARSWRKIHKKKSGMLNYKIICPGEDKERKKFKAIVGIDTSGSMTTDDLRKILGEIFNILNGKIRPELTVIQCDAEIQKIEVVKSRSDIRKITKMKGRGGTAYTPVMEWIVENRKKCRRAVLIYFTDFYGDQHDSDFKKVYERVKAITRRQFWVKVEGGKIKGVFLSPYYER